MGHVTLTMLIRAQSAMAKIALDIFYLHTKFDDLYFSHSGDMIVVVKTENTSGHTDQPLLGVVCHL